MTTLRTAAQQALEALEWCEPAGTVGRGGIEARKQAIAALRAALAQQDEPVAWMVYTEGGTSAYVTDNPHDLVGAYRALPLYTAPPQRKPLTQEESDNIYREFMLYQDRLTPSVLQRVVRAVERAHGIGEAK